MSIEKSWTRIVDRNSEEFLQGLKSFVERSKQYVDSRGLIRCPCRDCTNNVFRSTTLMRQHIHRRGFCQRYVTWKYHGEDGNPPVVMARGHDEDGGEEPPAPGVVPPRRRGVAKNLGLTPAWERNEKRPILLQFDPATATTVGQTHDLLIREISLYIWRDISLDKESWEKVSDAEKNGLYQHLGTYFDLHDIMTNPEQHSFKEGLNYQISKRYRSRKSYAKTYFEKIGGYQNVEEAKNNPPSGMNEDNWKKTVDFFTSEKHKKRSRLNKVNRDKQTIKLHGGTSSYSSTCYKRQLSRVEAFREHHINKDGFFDDPVVEEQCKSLFCELDEGQGSSSSNNPTPVDETAVFEKVLGRRRGHIRGIGHKPSRMASSSQSQASQPLQTSRLAELDAARKIFHDPKFQDSIIELIRRTIQDDNAGHEENDDNEENSD